jgi:Ca2+-binding RTX toxin-like protein
MATIQGIYIALFGRPADPLGLEYFNTATGGGTNLTAIGDLAATAEYQDRFDGMNNAQIVTAIYQSLFGRNPELAGLEYFVNELNSGRLNINNVAINILDGAQGADKDIVDNKIEAANLFTAAVAADSDALAGYQGAKGIAAGVKFLAPITADDATVPTQAQVDAAVDAVADGTGSAGEIFTLTAPANAITGGVDVVNGTSGDDTIRAVTADSLNNADIIDGGAGFDTLVIADVGIEGGLVAPVIKDVERINNADAATINLTSVTGVQQIWATGAANTYTNANLATVFGASVDSTVTVDYTGALAGTNDVVNLAVSGGAVLTLATADAAAVEGLNVAAVGNGTVAAGVLTALKAIEVSGSGIVTVTNVATTLTSFDASDSTGRVTYTSGALTADATVAGGSGNDVLNFAAATATSKVTIDGGAGNDQITGGAANDTINGGAGNDIITGGAGADNLTGGEGNDVFVYAAVAQSFGTTSATIDKITDFGTGSDKIDVSATGLAATISPANQILLENAVAALAPGATLAQAIDAADAFLLVDTVAWFSFGGNTYVIGADAAAATADFVVELTGAVDLSAGSFTF